MSHLSNQQKSYSAPSRDLEVWEEEIARHESMLNEAARIQIERYRAQCIAEAQERRAQAYRAAMAQRNPIVNENDIYGNWEGIQDYSSEIRERDAERRRRELHIAVERATQAGQELGQEEQKRAVLALIDSLSVDQMLTHKDPFLQALGKVLASKFVVNV